MTVVDGPMKGGLYKVRLAKIKLGNDEVNKIIKQMQEDSRSSISLSCRRISRASRRSWGAGAACMGRPRVEGSSQHG